jgi:thymidine phosphorylase
LLRSGAARKAFERIIDTQGRRSPPIMPGRLIHTFHSEYAGAIKEIDGWAVTEIARRAGAPLDKAAGVDILRNVGDRVEYREPLFVIHASAQGDLEEAARLAGNSRCHVIG